MAIVQLPDGTLVQIPDAAEPTSENKLVSAVKDAGSTLGENAKNFGGFVVDSAKSAARGLLGGLANASEAAANLPATSVLGLLGRGAKIAGESKAVQKALPTDPYASDAEKLWNSAMEGVGSAGMVPLAGAGVLPQAFTGMVSGLGGDLGGRYGASIDPRLKIPGSILGAGLAGGLAGFASGPKQTVAEADVRRALSGETPQSFAYASKNVDAFNNVGSKTATLAEAFSPDSGVQALAGKVRGGILDNALRNRTQNREQDLLDLGQSFLGRISPNEVDPNAVANQTSGAAQNVIKGMKEANTNNMTEALRGQTVPLADVQRLALNLRQIAAAQPRQEAGDAYRAVAAELMSQQLPGGPAPKLLTGVQDISFNLKALKDRVDNPLANNGAQQINKVDLAHAINDAEAGLAALSPAFAKVNPQFRDFAQNTVDPLKEGPIGSLAGQNGLSTAQTPVQRLGALTTGNSPSTIRDTLDVLQNEAAGTPRTQTDPGTQANAVDIARALAQQALRKGTTDPGTAVRGISGSTANNQFNSVLEAGGLNPAHVNAPLDVADKLQSFAQPAGMNELPEMSPMQLAIRPFRTLDMLTTGHMQRATQHETANLFATPTQENLAKLQQIAQFDPTVRAQLSVLIPFLTQANKGAQ